MKGILPGGPQSAHVLGKMMGSQNASAEFLSRLQCMKRDQKRYIYWGRWRVASLSGEDTGVAGLGFWQNQAKRVKTESILSRMQLLKLLLSEGSAPILCALEPAT